MKKVLCFGDSNTYGFNPENGGRYSKNERWSGVLSAMLGKEWTIIEAGCNNRTAFSDSPEGLEKTGYKSLINYLDKDITHVVLAIGINDLQKIYNPTLEEFYVGIKKLVNIVRENTDNTKIILCSPSVINEDILNSWFVSLFDECAIEKSLKLSEIYQRVSLECDCLFLDLNKIVTVSQIDGLHYSVDAHKQIAETLSGTLTSSYY